MQSTHDNTPCAIKAKQRHVCSNAEWKPSNPKDGREIGDDWTWTLLEETWLDLYPYDQPIMILTDMNLGIKIFSRRLITVRFDPWLLSKSILRISEMLMIFSRSLWHTQGDWFDRSSIEGL